MRTAACVFWPKTAYLLRLWGKKGFRKHPRLAAGLIGPRFQRQQLVPEEGAPTSA